MVKKNAVSDSEVPIVGGEGGMILLILLVHSIHTTGGSSVVYSVEQFIRNWSHCALHNTINTSIKTR